MIFKAIAVFTFAVSLTAYADLTESAGADDPGIQHLKATVQLVASGKLIGGDDILAKELKSLNAHLQTQDGTPISPKNLKVAGDSGIIVIENEQGEIIKTIRIPSPFHGPQFLEHEELGLDWGDLPTTETLH